MVNEIYRYLGYGTTDSNGVAKLDHDENGDAITHSYTGVGAGKVDIIASLDNPISSGSIVSKPSSIIDALFYDEALTDAKWNTNYQDVTANREITVDGTRVYYSSDSGTKYCNTVIGGTRNWFDSTKEYQIEFDFSYEMDSDSAVTVGIGSNGYNIHNHFNGALSGSGHYKIITKGNTYQFVLNGITRGTPITINGNGGLYFGIYRTGSITFKNLRITEPICPNRLIANGLDDFEIQSGTLTLEDGVFTKSTDGNVNLLNPCYPVRMGWSGAKTIEFDVVNRNTLGIQLYSDANHRFNQRISTLGGNDGSHVKIVYDGTYITPYIDGEEKTPYIAEVTFDSDYMITINNQGSFQNVIVY